MARISEINEASSKKGSAKPPVPAPKAPTSSLIYLLPLASVLIGVYANYTSIQHAPHGDFKQLGQLSPSSMRAQLGIPFYWGQKLDEVLSPPLDGLLYTLDLVFKQLCSTRVGRGLFAALPAAVAPVFAALMLEGLKDGSSALIGPLALTLVASIGQVVMIGLSFNVLYVPLWAFAAWRQVEQNPNVVRPLPSPPSAQVIYTAVWTIVSMLPFLLCLAVSPDSGPHFFIASTVFQFFPLFWLPIVLLRKQPAQPARKLQHPRLSAARLLSLSAYATVPIWWYALYLAGPELLRIYRTGSGFPDDASRLIFFDFLALNWSSYALVLLQAEVDLRAVQLGGPRVHRARLFIEDLVFGSSGLLILGPGFGMGTYFARREVLAEKARFGVLPELGGPSSVDAAREELDKSK